MTAFENAIIKEYERTYYYNEVSTDYNEKIENECYKAWEQVKSINYNENESLFNFVKNRVMETLKNNNLFFIDNRCYSYLVDGVFEMVKNIF